MMTLNGTELKTSIVLQAMVTGLLNSKNDPKFIVDMSAFGYVKNQLCYGCAATVTLVEMFGEGKLASEMMIDYTKAQSYPLEVIPVYMSAFIKPESSSAQDFLPVDFSNLERAVDYARIGKVSELMYLLTGEFNTSFDSRWCLETRNWEEQLPKIKETIVEMAATGY